MSVATEKTPTEKVTFVLPAELVKQLRERVGTPDFPSQNALVKEALRQQLKRMREAEFEREMEEAANDPLFIADLEECIHDFRFVDAETARLIPRDEDFDVAP